MEAQAVRMLLLLVRVSRVFENTKIEMLNERVTRLEEQLEAAQSERVRLEGELFKLDEWASRMPDASFTSDDPRWDWWHRRPRVVSIPATHPYFSQGSKYDGSGLCEEVSNQDRSQP